VISSINERIEISEGLLSFPNYDSKQIVENINFIVSEIKCLKERKYVYFII
jgi:hypothetical protein